ncbi:hypothetical protein FRB95_009371 [Tulasnella sp. JGI-2019a]|nr:hypothetical protein FRB95_009371 [Tulasnella sp. JGI-2019a]
MAEKEFKAGDDNKHGWARALLKKSWSSGPTPDTPPPYTPEERVIAAKEPNTLHPVYSTTTWFNFKSVKEVLALEVPLLTARKVYLQDRKSHQNLLGSACWRNPTKAAAAGNFRFLRIQLHLTGSSNEQWMLVVCDEGPQEGLCTGKPSPIFKDQANTLVNTKTEGKGPVGNPASSNIWSIHAIEGHHEELRLSWFDKDSICFPLKAVSEQTPKVSTTTNKGTYLVNSDVFVIFTMLRMTEYPTISGVEDRHTSLQMKYPFPERIYSLNFPNYKA